ncbi:MAG: hypothetical protein OHK0022_38830 [Roseiflexaceae bacterium]
MRTAILILGLLVGVLLVIFGVQNTQPVFISFLGLTSGGMSLSLVIMISAVIGALLASLVSLSDRVRQVRHHEEKPDPAAANRVAHLEARVADLERENAALRAAAHTDLAGEPLRARELGRE